MFLHVGGKFHRLFLNSNCSESWCTWFGPETRVWILFVCLVSALHQVLKQCSARGFVEHPGSKVLHSQVAKLIMNLLMTSVSCPFPSICSFLFFQIVFFSWCFCLLLFCISGPFLPVGLMHQHRALISSKAQLRSNHGSWQLMPLEVDTLQTTEILKRSQAHL